MAHFAELESKTDPTGFTSDTHLVVKRVVVVGNDCVPSDEHADGETWCVNFFGGGTWKQTSYNNNFRKQYAGIGMRYDASKNTDCSPPKTISNGGIPGDGHDNALSITTNCSILLPVFSPNKSYSSQ